MGGISIRTKLAGAFAATLLTVVALGLFGLTQLRAVNEVAQEGRELWLPQVELAGEMRGALAQHWALARRRSLTDDAGEIAAIDSEMKKAMAALRRSLADFPIRDAMSDEAWLLVDIGTLSDDYEAVLAAAFKDIAAGATANGRHLIGTAAADAVTEASGKVERLMELFKRRMRSAAERARAVYAFARLTTILLIVAAGGYALWAIAWTTTSISTPIRTIADAMKRLATGDASVTMDLHTTRRDELGVLLEAVAGYRDSLVQSRDLSRAAKREHARLQAAVDNMPVGLAMFDGNLRVIICNSRYGEIYGLPDHLLAPGTPLTEIMKTWVGLSEPVDADIDEQADRIARSGQLDGRTQQLVRLSNGRIVNVIRQGLSDGGWVATHEDVTERMRIEERIRHMARHDALTDLPNRVSFVERLTEQLADVGRNGSLAVLCLDLDRFKSVNDTLGHPAGDALLVQVAERLREATRGADMVARFGGDEFSIIQRPCAQPGEATALAERIIETLSAPYQVHGSEAVIGVSVGIAIAPGDGSSADVLLKHGDMALYRAKADGRGTYRLFEQEMDARMHARRALELDLRRALQCDEFDVRYQPIVDLTRSDVAGFEALLRWHHPERGMIPPAEFVPLAEEIGLIVPIGTHVLRKACLAAASWPDGIKVAVNISPVQFKNRNLLAAVIGALAVSGLPAHRLEIEITEGVLLQEADATLSLLHQLRALGVRIAMDDFGTGYSSLSYLRSFPFDKIKIDRSFISSIGSDESSEAIIRAVTTLSASMGIITTAEGVETREQLEHVRRQGCAQAQGFVFSAPKPADEVPELLRSLRAQISRAA